MPARAVFRDPVRLVFDTVRIPMHRRFRIVRAILVACCAGLAVPMAFAPTAVGWRAVVLGPDTTSLDLGRVDDAPAAFLTLEADGAVELDVARGTATSSTRVHLFVPDQLPERRMEPAQLPRLELDGDTSFQSLDTPTKLRDPATGLRVLGIGSVELSPGVDGAPRTLRVVAGDEPARALVVMGGGATRAGFELDDPTAIPGTVARMRAWSGTPPPGTDPRLLERDERDEVDASAAVIVSSVVAAAMVTLALWWALWGRRESRRRTPRPPRT